MDVLLSLVSAWSGVPLVNEDGGSLPVGLELGLIGVALTVFGGLNRNGRWTGFSGGRGDHLRRGRL